MLTEVLAIYAASISTISLAISYFAYRSDDPKLSGSAKLDTRFVDLDRMPGGPTLYVTLHNRGRGAITVASVNSLPAGILIVGGRDNSPWQIDTNDLELPTRIEGHSGVQWKIPLQKWNSSFAPTYVKPEILIGVASGETLTLKVTQPSPRG
jgi:hypothetical protein